MPKHRRAERTPDPREPKLLRAGQWLYSRGPKPLRAERSPDPGEPKLLAVEPRPSPPPPKRRRTERPLDPPEPRSRRTRRPALCAPIRRPTPIGHRPALPEPEGSLRPDRSLACPKPEGSDRFERSHPHPVVAEAPPGIRRPQTDTHRAEAPLAPDEPADPRQPEGCSVSVDPAVPAPTRRPNRVRRALRRASPATEEVGETCRRSPLGDRSPVDSSRGPKSRRIELLRSALREPKLLSNRTSGRDGPESFLTFRGLIPAAIRHSRVGCLGRRVARSSPGLRALQGVPPLCGGRGSHRAFPSWAFHHRARTTGDATLQGVARSEVGSSLSRPPTLMGFSAS
jgi:hypothetical protein